MPLIEGKSAKSFKKNLKTEVHAGKPLKQSLAIAYSMKRKADEKKMAAGGFVKEEEASGYVDHPGKDKAEHIMHEGGCAHGGPVHCNMGCYADGGKVTPEPSPSPQAPVSQEGWDKFQKGLNSAGMSEGGYLNGNEDETEPTAMADAEDTGYLGMPKEHELHNSAAMEEDERRLNQHGQNEQGPYSTAMSEGGQITDNYQSEAHMEDMVGRIMAKRQNHYSEGGRVANDTKIEAGFDPNEFDDLAHRDNLESSYGKDDNAGDDLDNADQNHLREDIVSRIMRSRAKKDRMPRPA